MRDNQPTELGLDAEMFTKLETKHNNSDGSAKEKASSYLSLPLKCFSLFTPFCFKTNDYILDYIKNHFNKSVGFRWDVTI